MLRRTVSTLSLLVLSACTVIEIEDNSNSIADSGNHSGRVTVPEITGPDASSGVSRAPEE
ncbi:hypothetical protein CR51_31855 [Caballeronia megalochromosomata]|jgi:hypothetical protein|nr:hypothetical protein CR51_31855 [Caballeronia megalochromosomata]